MDNNNAERGEKKIIKKWSDGGGNLSVSGGRRVDTSNEIVRKGLGA